MSTFLRGALAALSSAAIVAGCSTSSLMIDGDATSIEDGGAPDAVSTPRDAGVPHHVDASVADAAPDPHGNCGPIAIVCNGLCVDPTTDRNNCGRCGNVCPLDCEGGKCFCEAPYTACDDECRNLTTDPFNCGACGHSCNGGDCNAGVCSQCPDGGPCPPCPWNWATYCGGRCVVADVDPQNCGECGRVCPAGPGEEAFCNDKTCGRIGEIATAQASPVGIAVDDAYVYWWTAAGAILRAPKTRGVGLPTTLLDAAGPLGWIAMSSDAVVFTRPGDKTIARVKKDGSEHATPFILEQGEPIAGSVAIADAHVYWSSGQTIRVVPLAGGAPTTFLDAGANVSLVGSDGSPTLYWVQFGTFLDDGLYVASTASAPPAARTVGTFQQADRYKSLAVIAGNPCLGIGSEIVRFEPNATRTVVDTYLGNAGKQSGVAFDGATLAWFESTSLWTKPFDPSAASTIAFYESAYDYDTTTIAMDAEYIYIAVEGAGVIRRIAR